MPTIAQYAILTLLALLIIGGTLFWDAYRRMKHEKEIIEANRQRLEERMEAERKAQTKEVRRDVLGEEERQLLRGVNDWLSSMYKE